MVFLEARRFASFIRWYFTYYIGKKILSSFIKENPNVLRFSKNNEIDKTAEIEGINVFRPTTLCRSMTKHGSDKGSGSHNYTTIYSRILRDRRSSPMRIFELGLGTNNPNLPSSMGADGRPGASLRGWRSTFRASSLFGADIDRSILFNEKRIKTFYCDQTDPLSIEALWDEAALRDDFDVIVEDGLHTFEANISFFDGSITKIKPDGFYIIEDIASDAIEKWKDVLPNVYTKRYPDYAFYLVMIPKMSNLYDNNLLIVHRNPRGA